MEKVTNEKIKLGDGDGVQFWAYVSPQRDTERIITKWKVHLEHTTSNWMGDITSDDPEAILRTPDLSGVFTVKVTASGPNMSERTLKLLEDDPGSTYRPDIECCPGHAGMIGIVATLDGSDGRYWTVSNAF